jgi:hypothetical protein
MRGALSLPIRLAPRPVNEWQSEGRSSYRRFLVMPEGSGGGGLGLKVVWLGDDLAPVSKLHTSNDLWQLVVTVETAPGFLRAFVSLNTMASAVLFERRPFDRIVLCRTVAKVLSIGFDVRKYFQCSAGKS